MRIYITFYKFQWYLIKLNTFYREEEVGWDTEIKDDVIEECNKHGGVIHIYVDKNSAQVFYFFSLEQKKFNLPFTHLTSGVVTVCY